MRIDTTRLDLTINEPLTALARMGAAAFGYTADLGLDRHLAELLRLRVAQINNCSYCLRLHHRVARDIGVPHAKIDCLSSWWETRLFNDAEQAALAYGEALTRSSDTTVAQRFGPVHDRLARHFDPDAISEIVGVVVNMNMWTRLKLAEGSMPATD